MAYSESVYLDCVAPDGRTALVTRLAVHPDEGVSWLWAHLFLADGRAFSYNRQDLAPGRPGAATGVYETPDGGARFERRGDRATAHVQVDAHQGVTAPRGGGPHRLVIDADFAGFGAAGSNLPGRSERLGRVEASVSIDGENLTVSALGQFHEQHQEGPRFTVPFTYGTLRGDGLGTVFLVGPRRSGGFLVTEDAVRSAAGAELDPPGPRRGLRLTMDDGEVLVADLTRTWDYRLPINGHPRASSVVTGSLDGRPVSGCVNDWDPPVS